MQEFFPVVFSFNYKLLQYHNLLSVFLLWDPVKLSGRMKSFSLYFCYNLHLECLPKACVLMVFSLEWWYWEVVEPLRSRLHMVASSLCPWKRLCGGPLVSSPLSFILPDHEIRYLLCCVLSVVSCLTMEPKGMVPWTEASKSWTEASKSWTEASKIVSKSNRFLYRLMMWVFGIIAEDIILSNLKEKIQVIII